VCNSFPNMPNPKPGNPKKRKKPRREPDPFEKFHVEHRDPINLHTR